MGYKILYDYNTEGFKFDDKDYDSVDGALKAAIGNNYGTKFLIIEIIEWYAQQKQS